MATVQEILDTDIPRPTWALRPGQNAPLPDEVDFSRGSNAYTANPASGRYESISSGKQRIYGPNQELLVETGERTNFVRWSSDLSNWNDTGSALGSSVPSIIDDDKATAYKVGGTSQVEKAAGNSSSSTKETVSVFVQEDTASKVRIAWKDTSFAASEEVAVDFDFGNDSFSVQSEQGGTLKDTGFSEVGSNGSGARVLKLSFAVTPDASGNTRVLRIYGNAETGNGETIIHHAQIEEKGSATSPIVTGSSSEPRDADTVTIDLSGVFNDKEGTISVVFTPILSFYQSDQELLSQPGGASYLEVTRNSFPKPLISSDGDSAVELSNKIKSFRRNKVAIAFTDGERRLAANGEVQTGSHNGNLLGGSTLEMGRANHLQAAIDNIAYHSRALSESALKTLTSGTTRKNTSVVSPPILSSSSSSSLLQETQTFRDRVQNNGGTIEDSSLENLYDEILRAFKDFSGVGLSDLVFFGAGSAVENNSGSIPTLFDASGNENDATQSDTAKQPAYTTDSDFGGKAVALSDASDDILTSSFSSHTQPTTHLTLVQTNDPNTDDQRTISTTGGGDNSPYQTININNGEWRAFAGNALDDGSPDSTPVILTTRYDGANSIIRRDGVNEKTGDAGTMDIGSELALLNLPGRAEVFDGLFALGLVVAAKLTDSQLSEIESILTSYYSL